MHPEIEKLIDLAIADGQITEKERNVIFKKAAEFGVDLDEVEMILDGKLHQLEANKPKEKEKVGNIKTCPACGASVKAFQIKCDDCGHELQNTKKSEFLMEFKVFIEKIYSEQNPQSKYKIGTKEYLVDNESSKEKNISALIKSYPLPKNREDIIELLIYSYSNFESDENQKIFGINIEKPIKDAWFSKAKQSLELLEVYGENDSQSQIIINRYRKYFDKSIEPKKNNKKGCLYIFGIFFVIMIIISFIMMLIPLSEEDKKLKNEINYHISNNQLDSAIVKINLMDNIIEKKKTIDKIFNVAINSRDFENAKKVIKYYDNDIDRQESLKKIYNLETIK